jgi:DNA topoisomerase-2
MESTTVMVKKNKKKSKDSLDSELADQYKMHEHGEHIYELPDTYIGSIEMTEEEQYVLDENERMVKEKIKFIPGLYKIVDEIAVNALDQSQRLRIIAQNEFNTTGKSNLNLVKTIKIDVDLKENQISVYNDGEGIDIAMHPEHNIYIPSMIFGELLTSTNYNKNEKKITGGKNGYGAKLTNIFSKEFTVETVDHKRKKKFIQKYENNMKIKNKPIISDCKMKPYTIITFKPDLKRFGVENIGDHLFKMIQKRSYDLAACTDKQLSVYFNGKKISHQNFEQYVDLYIGSKSEQSRSFETVNDRWEIAASVSSDNQFEQISFVNGVCTTKGGKHIDHVSNIIIKKLSEYILKKKKINITKTSYIKDNLFIFVRSVIENPSFDSQLKETLTTNLNKFGSKCEPISDKFIEKLAKSGIMERSIAYYEFKENKKLNVNDGKKNSNLRGIEKLDDANWAGTSKSKDCTLILTEGDSAKSMAIAGLSVVGRDRYGVFPLRGKVLNVRDRKETIKGKQQIADNEEITNLKKILGLQNGKEYNNLNDLRYGRIMVMTDQDVDGAHIKGLIFNVFDSLWPSLIEKEGFMTSMITPIIKASKNNTVKSFYTLTDYENWKKDNNNGKGWKIKYYKGLGTSTSSEAKEYFKNLKIQNFYWNEDSKNSLDLAFNKDRADDRKVWLANYNSENILDSNEEVVYFNDFINKEFIHFSNYDVERSIPNGMDGFKTSLRKVLFSCLKRKLTSEIRVAQLAGYVSENAAYHHGEASLQGAIIGMAQDYVSSNNINFLAPIGQFGTRLQGGKDSASPRYIHTCLEKIVYSLFPEKDFPVLDYLDDDGLLVEPKYYCPILPTILINGSKGIGTGYSSDIPMYNPLDLLKNIKNLINGKELKEIAPWYYGFQGEIIKVNNKQYISKGKYNIVNYKTLEVTELPIGMWTEDYKNFLETLLIDYEKRSKKKDGSRTNKKNKCYLKNFQDHSSESKPHFVLEFKPDVLKKLNFSKENKDCPYSKLEKELKLVSTISTSNMCLFNHKCVIHKYNDVNEIIKEFFNMRLKMYEKRKQYLLAKMENDIEILKQKMMFILGIINEEIFINKRSKDEITKQLQDKKFKKMDSSGTFNQDGNYNYLISMPIYSLTLEKKLEIEKEYKDKEGDYKQLFDKTEKNIWLEELDEFELNYKKYIQEKDNKYNDVEKKIIKKKKK